MTRKRAIKLLMARGYSRNQAVRHFRAKPDGMCNLDWYLLRIAVSDCQRDVVIKDEAREWTRDSQCIRRLIEWGQCTIARWCLHARPRMMSRSMKWRRCRYQSSD